MGHGRHIGVIGVGPRDKGGKYMLETEATELLTENGKVVGVKAVKADGTKVTIHAKSVILESPWRDRTGSRCRSASPGFRQTYPAPG